MTRRLLDGLLLLVATVALAGCAGGEAFTAADLSDAAAKTGETKSMRMAMQMTVSLPEQRSATLTGTGEFDNERHRGRVTMDLRPLGEASGQDLGTITTIVDGLDVYMKMPFLRQAAPQLKPWLKFNLQEAAETQGLDVESLMQLGQGADPAETLAYLKAAGEVTEVADEKVRGVDTTRYSATIDLRKVPDLAPANLRDRVRRTIDQLIEMTGKSTQPMDVWVDEEGLVRRMSFTQALASGGQTTRVKSVTEMYDFGTAVEVDVPPANQVSDLQELMEQAKGAS